MVYLTSTEVYVFFWSIQGQRRCTYSFGLLKVNGGVCILLVNLRSTEVYVFFLVYLRSTEVYVFFWFS